MNDMKMLRFRESFRGYNKDDVNAYIEQINLKFSRKESELRAQIADLENTCQMVSSASQPAEAVMVEEDPRDAEIEMLRESNASFQKEIEALKAQLASCQTTNDAEEAENAEKSKLYDSMSAQVGNILIVANSNAEKILSDAKAEAERIRAEATYHAEVARLASEEKMNAMAYDVERRLQEVYVKCISRYEAFALDAKARLGQITDTMRERSKELLVSADQQMKAMEKQMNEDLSAIATE